MSIPSRETAEELLNEAGRLNPGVWTAHSRLVADGAARIAGGVPGMDPERAYVIGLLHDIGRRVGVTGMRHALDGYRYLLGLGYEGAARICMTHSFPNLEWREIFGHWDCNEEELDLIRAYLAEVELDDYDRLIQLCDALAMAHGFVLMEKRLLDVAIRYGPNEFSVAKWRKLQGLLAHFDGLLGRPVYGVLPGVVENSFGASPAAR